MTDAVVEPALPWGRPVDDAIADIPVGARIEVKWCMTVEEADAGNDGAAAEPDAVPAVPASESAPQPQAQTAAAAAAEQHNAAPKADTVAAEGVPEVHESTVAGSAPQADNAEPTAGAEAPEDQLDEADQGDAEPVPKQRILWWGATITGYEEEDGNRLAVLKYDAKEGFAEETRHVEFVKKGLLADGEDMMKWRLEGEESPESESEEEEEEEEAGAQGRGMLRTVQEDGQEVFQGSVADVCEHFVGRLADRYEGQLETLTPFQQSFMMNGMRDFFEAIRQKVEEKGPDGVMDEDDVREATREFQAKRRRI